MAFARREIPEQMSWITAAVEPAVRCCWDAVDEVQDIEASLPGFGRPVLLWNGIDDDSRSPAARLAARHENVQLLETPGDHMSAWFNDDVRRDEPCAPSSTTPKPSADQHQESEDARGPIRFTASRESQQAFWARFFSTAENICAQKPK